LKIRYQTTHAIAHRELCEIETHGRIVNLYRFLFRVLLGRRLPIISGPLKVSGPREPIRIYRDQWGIPHIEAANDFDAWFGLGFCQGQDRAFQLEGILRVSRGTLAELVGKKAIAVDRLSRRVGFVRAARRQWPVLSDQVQESVTAFAAGISEGMSRGLSKRPHEFVILGAAPTPWTPIDVLAFVKLQSFVLPSNWDAELSRLQVLLLDGAEALRALDPAARQAYSRPETSEIEQAARPAGDTATVIDALAHDMAAFAEFYPAGGASNNWVIGPERSATGRPLVCNDPHLMPSLPSQWYLAHLRTPEWSLAGATFAGSPAFAAGFNGHLAWGVTAGLIDNTDLFLEHLSADGRSVRQGGGFVLCDVHRETIQVKNSSPVTEAVVETPRGPIISPALAGEWPALSLRAVWLDPLPVSGFLAVTRVKTADEFRACFDKWPCLPLNIVFADTSGTIGYQMAGNAPRRKRGYGALPTPGWDDSFGWDGMIPFEQMPHVENPPEGFFATANNAPPGHERNSPLGIDWLDPYRLSAIREAMNEKAKWTVADCLKLQMDQRSLPWREMRPILLSAMNGDNRFPSLVVDHLQSWNGDLSGRSSEAALFEGFLAEMSVRIAKAKAPKSFEWMLGKTAWTPGVNLFYFKRVGHLSRLLREQPTGWFKRSWREEIADALAHSLDETTWRPWGELHPLRPKAMALGDIWPFKHIFSCGPIPIGGDTDTINQASVRPTNPIGETDNIAGMRMVVEVGNWSASRFVVAGGQSGNPLSPHYADLFEYWRRGEGVPMAWTPEEVRVAARQTLELHPI
jgi:penicillin amidase